MTNAQKKAAWERLSDSQKVEANQRKNDLIQSHLNETEAKLQELKESGKYTYGLGADPPEIIALNKKHDEELVLLQKEYGLA